MLTTFCLKIAKYFLDRKYRTTTQNFHSLKHHEALDGLHSTERWPVTVTMMSKWPGRVFDALLHLAHCKWWMRATGLLVPVYQDLLQTQTTLVPQSLYPSWCKQRILGCAWDLITTIGYSYQELCGQTDIIESLFTLNISWKDGFKVYKPGPWVNWQVHVQWFFQKQQWRQGLADQ